MSFGFKRTLRTYQRLTNKVIVELNEFKAFVYLNDIITYVKDPKDHFQKFTEIFPKLCQYNLKLQLLKCEILRKEVTYLGHIITNYPT